MLWSLSRCSQGIKMYVIMRRQAQGTRRCKRLPFKSNLQKYAFFHLKQHLLEAYSVVQLKGLCYLCCSVHGLVALALMHVKGAEDLNWQVKIVKCCPAALKGL